MEPWKIAGVVLAASVIASFTDWVFMGLLFHDRYERYPEVWREGRSEGRKILISQAIGVLACAGFVSLCLMLPHHLTVYLKAAAAVWLAAVVPIMTQNGVWMKLHPLVLGSHAVGWAVRFLITAVVLSLVIV